MDAALLGGPVPLRFDGLASQLPQPAPPPAECQLELQPCGATLLHRGATLAHMTRGDNLDLHTNVFKLVEAGVISMEVVALLEKFVVVQVSLLPAYFTCEGEGTGFYTTRLVQYWKHLCHLPWAQHRPDPYLDGGTWAEHAEIVQKLAPMASSAPLLGAQADAADGDEDSFVEVFDGRSCASRAGKVALRDIVFATVLPQDWREEAPNPPGLLCTLYHYQKRALAWMLWRESLAGPRPTAGDRGSVKSRLPQHHELCQPTALPSDGTIVYRKVDKWGIGRGPSPPLPQVASGILAEEMGLGKTVMMIALVLANRPPLAAANGSAAGSSWAAAPEGRTLVVCPPALLAQWVAELKTHAGAALTVQLYQGLKTMIPTADDGAAAGGSKRRGKKARMTDAQREFELYSRRAAGEAPAVHNAQAEAEAVARQLAQADVVVTSFDVLQREIHYTPSARGQAGMRHAKRYIVPECPLVQVCWHRLVADEAQMCRPFGATGQMLERMQARHRWCVTGTPITSSRELEDLQSLLCILQHQPFSNANTWDAHVGHWLSPWNIDEALRSHDDAKGLRRLPPLTSQEAKAHRAWRLLQRTLRPIMWRNSKEVVRREHPLPARTLQEVRLTLQAGEQEFYRQVVDHCRATRDQLKALKAQQQEEEEGGGGGSPGEEGAGPSARGPPTPLAAGGRRKRRQSVAKLEAGEVAGVTQLRLACIHPQLTQNWQEMSCELQLAAGGTLSMEEILARLVDKAQHELQEAERSLCSHLNTLAMVLLGVAGSRGAGGSGESPSADAGDPGSPAGKKRRKSSAPAPAEAVAAAISLLEQSFRVSEKGIDALDLSLEELEAAPEPAQAAASSWRAWKRVQINTAAQLAAAYRAGGRNPDAISKEVEFEKRIAELREQADGEVARAESKGEELRCKVAGTREQVERCFLAGADAGFPTEWGQTRDATSWLAALDEEFQQAAALEKAELAAQASSTYISFTGTRVQSAMADAEKRLQPELSALEAWVGAAKTNAGIKELQEGIDRVNAKDPADNFSALRWRMGALAKLLPPARQATLLSQYEAVLPFPRACKRAAVGLAGGGGGGGQGDVKGTAPSQQQQQLDAPCNAANGQQRDSLEQIGPSDGSAAAGLGCSGGQQAQQEAEDRALQQALAAAEAEDAAGAEEQEEIVEQLTEDVQTTDAKLLAAAGTSAAFIHSDLWRGRLRGYAFGLGSNGLLGYHMDHVQRKTPPLPELVLLCGQALLKALRESSARLARQISSSAEAAALRSCDLDAAASKLESVAQQVVLTRLLREAHTADCNLALKAALKEDVAVEVQAAKQETPVAMRSPDILQRHIQEQRAVAQELKRRKNFMCNRLQELQQPAAASTAGPGGAEPAAAPLAEWDSCAGASGGSSGFEPVHGPAAAVVAQRPGLECPVCLAEIRGDMQLLPCAHSFCLDCANKLRTLGRAAFPCPVCRVSTTIKQMRRVAAGSAPQAAAECDPGAQRDAALARIQVRGQWSIKVAALLRRVLALAASAPQEKCLVFSQFPLALKLVALALKQNDLAYVELLGGSAGAKKAIKEFREREDVRVFLLAHRAGAQGLTLVQASHVFLLEPALDPAIEQQAVARVHRIGQQRPVRVVRLVVADTIEEQVLRLQQSRQALFDEAAGSAEDDDEVTAVDHPVAAEVVGRQEAEQLLDAVLPS